MCIEASTFLSSATTESARTLDHGYGGGVDDTSGPLAGYTVGITAERRREEFAAALERQGATVISGPAIQILPLVEDRELLAAPRRARAAPLDSVVATTGVGFRGW